MRELEAVAAGCMRQLKPFAAGRGLRIAGLRSRHTRPLLLYTTIYSYLHLYYILPSPPHTHSHTCWVIGVGGSVAGVGGRVCANSTQWSKGDG
jgi:hypothetical protein